jgi:trehalose synthase
VDAWHVNTTRHGGGVAEILTALAQVGDTAEVRHRRFITSSDPAVFQITKVLHHRLHGVDAGPLPDVLAHRTYLDFGRSNAESLLSRLAPGDLVVLHDPQTLPMASWLAAEGVPTAWRCHIGTDHPNPVSSTTWDYLRELWPAELLLVFSSPRLVPRQTRGWRVEIIAPSIQPDAIKNAPLPPSRVATVLGQVGLLPGYPRAPSRVTVISEQPVDGDPVILQVSRWDPLKDMAGVLRAFAESPLPAMARLVLCGPSPDGIADDPEAVAVLAAVTRQRAELPPAIRRRVHLVCPDLFDQAGNALLVNALQRRADVVVQKSRQEGFGLTVTEAMWKARPVVATRVGGITSQITHGDTGLLVDDPDDLVGVAGLVGSLLGDRPRAEALGAAAARRATERFTTAREAADHHRLYRRLALADPAGPA